MKAKLPNVWFAGLAVLLLLALAALPATLLAQGVTTTVEGTDGPWSVTQNPGYNYTTDGVTGPDVVSSASGIAFSAGDTLTVKYASGCVNTGSPYSYCVDADGQTAAQTDQNEQVRNQTSGFPSYYIDSSMDPIYLSELVGVFAHNGVIVGAPFTLGDSWSGTIPNGANELLLGVNDGLGVGYSDNTGSWNLSVTEGTPSAPALIATASLPLDAGGMNLNPGLNRLYVSGTYKTYVIDASQTTYPVLTSVGGGSPDVDLHTNNFWTAYGVYNGTTNAEITGYSGVSGCPIGAVVDSENRIGYVIAQCGGGNDPVFAFNADTFALLYPLGSGGVNGGPTAVDTSTEVLFWNTSNGPEEWDLAPLTPTVYSVPQAVGGVNPVTNIGYAVNGSSLYIMDVSNPAGVSVTHTITLSGSATSGQVGVNPTIDHFYIGETNASSGYLYIYDGATNTVTANVDFGANIRPQDIVADSSRNLVYVEATNTSTNAKFLYVVQDVGPAPAVEFSPTSLAFPNQTVGTTSAAQTVTVTNTGNANLVFGPTAVTIGGDNASDFAIASDSCSGQSIGFTAPSNTCAVSVTFSPSAATNRVATLDFTDNAGDSPQSVSLSGAGITIDQQIKATITLVDNLSGVLNGGQEHSLVKQLKDALKMACAGKINGAIGNLESFIGEVQDLQGSGVLTTLQAMPLIDAANQAIDALQSGGPLGCS